MDFDFETKGVVKIGMIKYVEDMINTFPEKITKEAATPAAPHLFKVREDNVKQLSDDKADTYHTITAKGLFLCKRARPDIQTTIAFLSTRVKNSDEDDWKKLQRLISYLKATKDLLLTLSSDKLNILKWHIDAAHQSHNDMKGHTGATLTMGKGGVLNNSTKQKINTRSSTESEIVGVDDTMPQVL